MCLLTTLLEVAGSVTVPGGGSRSGSEVGVIVVIVGVVVRRLIRVVRIIPDHHILSINRWRTRRCGIVVIFVVIGISILSMGLLRSREPLSTTSMPTRCGA